MNKIAAILLAALMCCTARAAEVTVGAARLDAYVPVLKGKRVGVLTNHTGVVDGRHLVDTLLSLGVDIKTVFAPEHGFRGQADAGEKIDTYRDQKTGVEVVSIYGSNRKPKAADVQKHDIILFDIQDVGLRYYTYLSSMHYMMETCAETSTPFIVLDRPNPNGMYIDGPLMEDRHRSFVGMHAIPIVHGMTLGELAMMINAEGWLAGGAKCDLQVIPCVGYTHKTRYQVPIAPSPNLPNMRAIYLYPSLCCMEGTVLSVGRGTQFPFQVYGNPALKGRGYDFTFTPGPMFGSADPPLKGQLCYGRDMRLAPSDEELITNGVDLSCVVAAYKAITEKKAFFNAMFEKLIGVSYVRIMIEQGAAAPEIKARWKDDVENFRTLRRPYLLYEE